MTAFDPNGVGIEQVPLERLIGRALLIDLRESVKINKEISIEDVRNAKRYREPRKDLIVVFHTGWVKDHFGKPTTLGSPGPRP